MPAHALQLAIVLSLGLYQLPARRLKCLAQLLRDFESIDFSSRFNRRISPYRSFRFLYGLETRVQIGNLSTGDDYLKHISRKVLPPVPRVAPKGKGLFVNSQKRLLHANDGNQTTRTTKTLSGVPFSLGSGILSRNVQWFRGGLVSKAHRLLYQETLDLTVMKKKSSGTWNINVQRFRGGLVSKADRLLYQSTLGLRVIKKKRR